MTNSKHIAKHYKKTSQKLEYIQNKLRISDNGKTKLPDIEQSQITHIVYGQITIGAAIKDFLDERRLRNLSEHSIGMYATSLKCLAQYLGQNACIDNIGIEQLRGFINEEKLKGRAPKTIKTRQQCIKTLFKFLVEEEFIDKDPSLRLAPIKVPRKVGDPLNVEDVQAIIDYFDASTQLGLRNRLIVLLLADTGARVSEIAGIELSNINLDSRTIKVMGKGSKERYLNISQNTKLELGKYLRKHAPYVKRSIYLFPNPYSGHLSRAQIGKILSSAGKSLGIPNVHPHRFRRTFATVYLSEGGDPFTLQKELGHSDLQMVQQYLSVCQKDVSQKHEKFGLGAKLLTRKLAHRNPCKY